MAKVKGGNRIRWNVVTLAVVLVPAVVQAQTAKAKKSGTTGQVEVEEITVVAQKREESIQEVPVSVTALTGAMLDARGVADVSDIGKTAPGVRIETNTGTTSGTTVAIRGTAAANPNLSFETAAGLYVDGVYISKIQGSNLDLEDLERVEVLRGPQGTLYGRNTIAGAINFITQKPTEERSLLLRSEAGNYDYFKGRLTANIPLIGKNGFFQSDALGTLSLRQNVVYKTHDGYYRNQSPTTVRASGGSAFNDLNRIFSMTALRWQPIQPLTVDYSFEYHRYRNGITSTQLTFVYPNSPVSAGRPLDATAYIRKNRVDAIGNNMSCNKVNPADCTRLADDGNHHLHVLTAEYALGELGFLGNVRLKSTSSYRNLFHQNDLDNDGTPLELTNPSSLNKIQHWSEELQLVGSAPRLKYVLGGYYYGEHDTQDQRQVLLNGATNLASWISVRTESLAPYGQLTLTPPILSDKLSVTLGMRYTHDQVHMERISRCVVVTSVIAGRPVNVCNSATIPVGPNLRDWKLAVGKAFGGTDGISPMGNIAYQWTDDLMTYFRIARGFKGGGFNGTTTDPRAFVIPFGPEKLLQYEAGFKSEWLDHRLRINADGYYSDYRDLQQSVFRASPEVGALSIISNVDSAEIWGSEVEVTAIPFRGFEVTGTYSYTSPKFLKWLDQRFDASNRPVFDANGKPVLDNVARQRSFAFTPEHQATLGFSYTAPPTSSGTFSAHLDGFWQDKVVFIGNNNTLGAHAMTGWNYSVWDGRLQFAGIPLQRGSLDIAVFSRNLFDRKYRTAGVDVGASLGWSVNNYGDPRTFGLQLTYNLSAS